MTSATIEHGSARRWAMPVVLPYLLWGLAFVFLFAKPAALLARDWWTDPEAGHGLLLAPAAVWLAFKRGLVRDREGNTFAGLALLALAVTMRLMGELAAELFTMRFSLVIAIVALVVFYLGWRQLVAWWLPAVLLALAIPLPELIRSAIALPLQFRASALGASLLEWRQVPVELKGNIIQLPGHRLFVTEACSGLRSLTALLSLAVLIGGVWMRHPLTRVALLAVAVPIAILLNGVRVFLTGFLVYFVDPKLGEGFMHLTEGWLLFVVSFGIVGVTALGLRAAERWLLARSPAHG